MIRTHFLSPDDRADLIALARNGSAAHRLARRANALVLLDDGWSCENVARALLLDDDTIRGWHGLFVAEGLEGLARFEAGGSACQVSDEQQEKLKAWVAAALPRTTRQIGAWIEKEFGVVYEGRSGLIALLHRLGLEYHKPSIIPRKLDKEKQKAFIESYDNLLNWRTTKPCCSRTRYIQPMPRGPSAAGRRARRSSRSSKRAGVSASTFTARSIWRPAKPG